MITLPVALGERSYPIHIGLDLMARAGEILGPLVEDRQVLIVTNEVVAPLYADRLRAGLLEWCAGLEGLVLQDGEEHKTLNTMATILDALVEQPVGRDGCLIALGGGVTGDVSGFAAACYQRGIQWIQVPTTLLAQVDSAVGGKTAVNHPAGKNLIGAFHQPVAVLSDLETLHTLDDRQYRAGLAEVVKYGLIVDAPFFDWLEQSVVPINERDPNTLAQAIKRCCAIKASVVARDEQEHGERALLNLGHTFGHGIERAMGYGGWLHGEAVAAGMVMAANMSALMGWLTVHDVERIAHLLQALGLPISPPPVGARTLLQHMRHDKKNRQGRLTLILMQAIGRAIISNDFDEDALHRTLASADS